MSTIGGLLLAAVLLVGVAACDIDGGDGGLDVGAVDSGTVSGADDDTGGGSGAAKTFFVSPDGDDGAGGLSRDTPFRTIARAVRSLRPGDTLEIAPASYREAVRLEGFGDASATITIRGGAGSSSQVTEQASPVGELATFDGGRTLDAGIWCDGCVNVVFENLEFRDYTDMGVLVTLSRSVTLRNLTFRGNGFAATRSWVDGFGMHADDSSDITIEGCEAFDNGPNPQRPGRWLGTGIDTNNLTDSVIRDNNSHDNTGGGMLVEDCTNVLVERNTITGNNLDATVEEWWDGGIWIDGGHDITLRDNIITGNIGPGVEISNEDNQNVFGYVLENNTVTGNKFGLYIWNFGTTGFPPDAILRLTDNNVSDSGTRNFWIVDYECPPDDPCE